MSSLEHDEAIALVDEGYSIIPLHNAWMFPEGNTLCTCGVSGCDGKHPRIQFSKVTINERKEIDQWWNEGKDPQPNIGIHLGKSYCWVLDVDGSEGIAELKTLTDKYGALPETRLIQSGSGNGLHYFFAGWVDKINSGSLTPNIHLKGNLKHALAVAPPSKHISGNRYRYLNRCTPVDAPEWLLNLIKKTGYKDAVGSTLTPEQIQQRTGYEVPITKLLTEEHLKKLHREGRLIMGYHLTHPSNDSPREFTIDPHTNRWHCWWHNAGGGIFELAAILGGICNCDDFARKTDAEITLKPLSGRKFKQAVQYCLDNGIDADSLKIHISGGKYHAK